MGKRWGSKSLLQNDGAKNCHSEHREESAFDVDKKADSSAFAPKEVLLGDGLRMTIFWRSPKASVVSVHL